MQSIDKMVHDLFTLLILKKDKPTLLIPLILCILSHDHTSRCSLQSVLQLLLFIPQPGAGIWRPQQFPPLPAFTLMDTHQQQTTHPPGE
jgi:hypothetical protein